MSDFENTGSSDTSETPVTEDINTTPVVTQPQAEQEPSFYDTDGRIADSNIAEQVAYAAKEQGMDIAIAREVALKKEYKTKLAEFQRLHFYIETNDGLDKKYPHVFISLTLPNGKKVLIQRVDTKGSPNGDPLLPDTSRCPFVILTEDGVLRVGGTAKDFQNLDGKMIQHMISKKGTPEPPTDEFMASWMRQREDQKGWKGRIPWQEDLEYKGKEILRSAPKSVLDQEFFTYFGADKDYPYQVGLNREKFKEALQANEKKFADREEIKLMQRVRNQDSQNLLNQL